MKLLTTIAKNLKLLFRSKESAYTIIFGPLLIILIVSFAFLGSTDEYTIRVGTYAPEHTDLSERTIGTLTAKDYLLSVYPSQEECVESVRAGTTHACMVFGKRQNETAPVTFYLDKSRLNLVYQIAEDLDEEMELQADAIRRQLAGNALQRMETAATLIDEDLATVALVLDRLGQAQNNLRMAREAIDSVPEGTVRQNETDLRMIRGYQQGLALNVRAVAEVADDSLAEALATMNELQRECDCSEELENRVERVEDDINAARERIAIIQSDTYDKQLSEANLLIEYAIEDLEQVKVAMANMSASSQAIGPAVSGAGFGVEESAADLRRVAGRLEYTRDFLRGEETSAEGFSAPITTSVVSVTAEESRLAFAYPYLLMLVIMFIGILLSSMLVVTDRTSRAAFRNFTTPTSDRYHVGVSFLTAFIILLLEVIVILAVSSLFIAQPLLLNPVSTVLIAAVAIALFTFLGMIIGYLSRTQEAAMIASISVGSVLLFVSNLVLPIEGMAQAAQSLAAFNPYIVLSELLKKSMLYGVSLWQVLRELALPVLLALALLGLTMLIQRHMKRRYFRQEEGLLPTHVPAPLRLGEALVHNEVELMDALDRMTRVEFERIVTSEDNIVAQWAAKELRNRRLAKQLRTRSKERMILKLDGYLARHGKKLR